MVKNLLTLLAALFFLSSCGDMYDVSSMVPWYVPYIKNTVDLKDLLPDQYNGRDIAVVRLTGPDAMNLDTYISYIVLVQYRGTSYPLIAVFNDTTLKLLYSASAGPINDPQSWFINGWGSIVFGQCQINPPLTPGAAWTTGTIANSPNQSTATYINSGSSSNFSANVSNFGNSLYIELGTNGNQYPWSHAATTLVSNFWLESTPSIATATSTGFNTLNLRLSNGNWPLAINGLNVCSIQPNLNDPANPQLEILMQLTLTANGIPMDIVGPVFGFEVPLNTLSFNGTNIAPATARSITFDNGNQWQWPSSSPYSTTEEYQACTFTGDGFVNCFPVRHDNNSNQSVLQMFFNDLNGALVSSMNLTLPNIPTPGNHSSIASLSGISQRPYYLSGRSDFIVVDTLHKRLVLCRPWWR